MTFSGPVVDVIPALIDLVCRTYIYLHFCTVPIESGFCGGHLVYCFASITSSVTASNEVVYTRGTMAKKI